ncbi:hypothetical protein OEZ86_011660 [Tetradesmus obliquus]|nr:hypothetical protein OEZ86_011660 [Tetradesmus obliquus]
MAIVPSPPAITLDPSTALAGLVVDVPVRVAVNAIAGSSNTTALGLKLRLTFFGANPMYIVRAQASDMMSGWSTRDIELLVRKAGDTQARAPCCRTTANIVALQLGRPIDPKRFRPAWLNVSAMAAGWDWDYLQGPEDLEAERLFDYGLLAPVDTGPWRRFTCADKYLAGPGSPQAWGTASGNGIGAATNQGRNKRVAVVPEGFSWATTAAGWGPLPSCVTHWSSWVASTPYGRVLSPLPRFINTGFTAWANAGGSPLMFVMRCNPQHYYLVHEFGHRVGMAHATAYRLNDSADAKPPTSPLGPGVMEDTYSDRLDMMACCKGDYSLHNRILSGWVPARERVTLSLADLTPAAQPANGAAATPRVRRYSLWPFDRPESKGQLKGASLRLEDGKVLVLGFRSTPFWQDVRIKANASNPYSEERPLAPEHMRSNVQGLSVEYSKRYLDAPGNMAWSIRGLLDFNMAFARFPDALPPTPGAYPPNPPGAVFTLLREGDAFLDEEHNLLLAVERIAQCAEQPLVPVYSYSVPNFYGFRGENPGEEASRRADYSGYAAGIKCLQLRVVTGVMASPGTLDARVQLQGLDEQQRLVLGGDQCGFPVTPSLQLVLPDGVEVITIVWRDNLNRTVALDTTAVQLPPLAPLMEASVANTEQCNSGCDWSYHVKILAADGAQTQIDMSFSSASLSALQMTATYSYYLKRSILQARELHSIPVVRQPPQRTTSSQGQQLLSQPATLDALAQQVFGANVIPDSTCSKQWSLSLNLDVPASALEAPSDSSTRLTQLLKVYAGDGTALSGAAALGWPTVHLRVSQAAATLLVQWGDGAANSREQMVGPWSNCSARCGGGWASREVRCMRVGGRGSPPAQVPLEECPLAEEVPVGSRQCNTAACPSQALHVLASEHSSCGRGCTVLGSEADGGQLVCINSLGQVQPLAQCCESCSSSTDWTSIQWSSSASSLPPFSSASLGSGVRALQPAGKVPRNASLATVVMQGGLSNVCQARDKCSDGVRWQLGGWSPCSTSCGGGYKRRSATCVSVTGDAVSEQQCIKSLGGVPSELLTAECASRPCLLHTWKVSAWSTCGGDASFGHASRSVHCVSSHGTSTSPVDESRCKSAPPAKSVTCLQLSQSAICRPGFVADTAFAAQDCVGHGSCTMNGCQCEAGWHGQFCEVPDSCAGVMTKSDKCCASGVLDVQGACCDYGAVLDSWGACCAAGRVDKCGKCGGSSWTVDITVSAAG